MSKQVEKLYKYFAPVVDFDNDEYETIKRILEGEIVFKKKVVKVDKK